MVTAIVRGNSALEALSCTTDHRYAQNIRIDGVLRKNSAYRWSIVHETTPRVLSQEPHLSIAVTIVGGGIAIYNNAHWCGRQGRRVPLITYKKNHQPPITKKKNNRNQRTTSKQPKHARSVKTGQEQSLVCVRLRSHSRPPCPRLCLKARAAWRERAGAGRKRTVSCKLGCRSPPERIWQSRISTCAELRSSESACVARPVDVAVFISKKPFDRLAVLSFLAHGPKRARGDVHSLLCALHAAPTAAVFTTKL